MTFIHDRLAIEMNGCLQEAGITVWRRKMKVHIDKKTLKKGPHNNYRSITCLPKILTVWNREEIYDLLISRELFPEEQKGCCMVTRCAGE